MTTNTSNARPAIYARVVDAESAEPGIDRQVRSCRQQLAKFGYRGSVVFADVGTNIRSRRLQGLADLLAAVAGGEVSAVAVTDISRLGRRLPYVFDVVEELHAHRVPLIVAGRVHTDEDRLALAVMATLEQERSTTR